MGNIMRPDGPPSPEESAVEKAFLAIKLPATSVPVPFRNLRRSTFTSEICDSHSSVIVPQMQSV
jgi:hypothetical protein